jgi:hypothetical protein
MEEESLQVRLPSPTEFASEIESKNVSAVIQFNSFSISPAFQSFPSILSCLELIYSPLLFFDFKGVQWMH